MFTREFWVRATERAIKSGAQFAVLAWGTVTFTKVGEVLPAVQATGLAFLFGVCASYLTSLASVKVGPSGDPSVVE